MYAALGAVGIVLSLNVVVEVLLMAAGLSSYWPLRAAGSVGTLALFVAFVVAVGETHARASEHETEAFHIQRMLSSSDLAVARFEELWTEHHGALPEEGSFVHEVYRAHRTRFLEGYGFGYSLAAKERQRNGNGSG